MTYVYIPDSTPPSCSSCGNTADRFLTVYIESARFSSEPSPVNNPAFSCGATLCHECVAKVVEGVRKIMF